MYKKLLFVSILFISQFNYAMDEQQLQKIIEKDDIATFESEFNKVSFEINGTASEQNLLAFALNNGADKIAQFLSKKISMNTLLKPTELYFEIMKILEVSPLFCALVNDSISIDTIKILLERGPDIKIMMKLQMMIDLSTYYISLFEMLHKIYNKAKQQFLIDYLIQRYGEDVLLIVLENQCKSLEVIQELVARGANIPKNIVDFAKKIKVDASIINFLERQINIEKNVIDNTKALPDGIGRIISTYAYGPQDVTNNSSEEKKRSRCIVC